MFRAKFLCAVSLVVVGCSRPVDSPAPDRFEAGLETVTTLVQGDRFGEALEKASAMVDRFDGHPRIAELRITVSTLEAVLASESELLFAVDCLDSDNESLVDAARLRLKQTGDAAALVLKNVAERGEGRLSLQAAELLGEIEASAGVAATIDKIRDAGSDSASDELGKSLVSMIGDDPDAATIKALYPMVKLDRRLMRRDLVGILCRYYTDELGRDSDRLNSLVDDPAAYVKLRSYVRRALESKEESHREWAAGHLGAFGLMLNGLRGSYYEGLNFEKLVHEQLDAGIDIPDRKFPYPDNRQENISVRWVGSVRIPTSGKYIFSMASDDGQRLWVAGKQLVDDWNYHGVLEMSGEITLEKGTYPFKAEFMQGGGGGETHVHWRGPGIKKQIIPASAFLTPPWR